MWEDETEPQSVKLNSKVYQCKPDEMKCDCPLLLCTGAQFCERRDDNPIKCELTKPYEDIDLQDAKRPFFGKGDCRCYTL